MKKSDLSIKITAGIQKAISDALLRHKMLGQSIAVWQDGKVVIIPASKIKIPSIKNRKTHVKKT